MPHRPLRCWLFGHATVSGAVLLQGLSLRQRDPQSAIPAETSGRGQDKISHAGQAGERERAGAQGNSQPGYLGEASSNQSCPGVMSHAEPLENAGRNGDDVLECARELA